MKRCEAQQSKLPSLNQKALNESPIMKTKTAKVLMPVKENTVTNKSAPHWIVVSKKALRDDGLKLSDILNPEFHAVHMDNSYYYLLTGGQKGCICAVHPYTLPLWGINDSMYLQDTCTCNECQAIRLHNAGFIVINNGGIPKGAFRVLSEAKLKEEKPVYRTQKAKGLYALSKAIYKSSPAFNIVQNRGQLRPAYKFFGNKAFARPCPSIPRHGFVDSRVVESYEDLESVWDEAEAQDPKAELIVSKYIESDASITLTPTTATIGSGNDGSTAGHDSITIPVDSFPIDPKLLKDSDVKNSPYFEAVIQKGGNFPSAYLTQLRDGPKLEYSSTEFIPEDITVAEVQKAEGDLLAWEMWAEKHASTPGLIVWHPGGNLLSHYAVHCRLNRIPIVCHDKEPTIGETLVANVKEKEDPYNKEALQKGLARAFDYDLTSSKNRQLALYAILFACHHANKLRGEYTEYLGLGIGLLIRLGTLGCVGEMRYSSFFNGLHEKDRNDTYKIVGNNGSINYLGELHDAFRYLKWGAAYGGNAWAKCAKSVIDLVHGIRNNKSTIQLIKMYHTAVNAAHNGGWWLDKFSSDGGRSLATYFAEGQIPYILKGIYGIYEILRNTSDAKLLTFPRIKYGPLTKTHREEKIFVLPHPKSAQWRILTEEDGATESDKLVRVQWMQGDNERVEKTLKLFNEPKKSHKFHRPSQAGTKKMYATGVVRLIDGKLNIYGWGEKTPLTITKATVINQPTSSYVEYIEVLREKITDAFKSWGIIN